MTTDDATGQILGVEHQGSAYPDLGALLEIPGRTWRKPATHIARSRSGAVAVLFNDGLLVAIESHDSAPLVVCGSSRDEWRVVIEGDRALPDNRLGGTKNDPAVGIAYSNPADRRLVVTFKSGARATWGQKEGWHDVVDRAGTPMPPASAARTLSARMERMSDQDKQSVLLAQALAVHALANKVDLLGQPIFQHAARVAEGLCLKFEEVTAAEIGAAYLHDVTELTRFTADLLLNAGVSPEAISIVKEVSRPEGVRYSDWIDDLVSNGSIGGVKVKSADNDDNSLPWRVAALPSSGHTGNLLEQRYIPAKHKLDARLRREGLIPVEPPASDAHTADVVPIGRRPSV